MYDEPEIYDVVSPWPIDDEVDGLLELGARWIGARPRSMLDPACGSGRILEAFARRGLTCAGIDLSRPMVEYARRRLRSFPNVEVGEGDMRDFDLGGCFDLVVQPVNTFRLLVEDDDIAAHLSAVRSHVARGVYVIELWLEGDDGSVPDRDDFWTSRRSDVTARVAYTIERVDLERRRSYERTRVWYRVGGRQGSMDELTPMRLWRATELERFVFERGAWTVVEWLDDDFRTFPPSFRQACCDRAYAVLRPT